MGELGHAITKRNSAGLLEDSALGSPTNDIQKAYQSLAHALSATNSLRKNELSQKKTLSALSRVSNLYSAHQIRRLISSVEKTGGTLHAGLIELFTDPEESPALPKAIHTAPEEDPIRNITADALSLRNSADTRQRYEAVALLLHGSRQGSYTRQPGLSINFDAWLTSGWSLVKHTQHPLHFQEILLPGPLQWHRNKPGLALPDLQACGTLQFFLPPSQRVIPYADNMYHTCGSWVKLKGPWVARIVTGISIATRSAHAYMNACMQISLRNMKQYKILGSSI